MWQRCLAGALCLVVSGALPANDQEVTKPLDRLKLRSARQRWRELRGEWVPAPDVNPPTLPDEMLTPEVVPHSRPKRNQTTPVPPKAQPAVSGKTTEVPWVAAPIAIPVPAPQDITPEVDRHAFAQPEAQSPANPGQPSTHPGSFGDVVLETQVATPRERTMISLPHWPFSDDLDLVELPPGDEAPEVVVETQVSPSMATELFSPLPAEVTSVAVEPDPVTTPEQPVLTVPIQVAEVPAAEAPASVASPAVSSAQDIPPLPAEDATMSSQTEQFPLARLKSIKDIEPFYNDTPLSDEPKTAHKKSPQEKELELEGSLERNHSVIPVYWQASNVSHNPLYFEDSGLERSGHSFSEVVQPFVSVGRFGAQVIALPYSIALDPVWKRETPLGHYRPGECAPKRHLALPINGQAAAVAATAYTGIIYLIP